MLQAAQNNLFLKIKTKYISNISNIMQLSSFQQGSTVDPTDIVNIVGEVVSIPKSITADKRTYEGFSAKDIKVGDTAIFRYDVVYDFISRELDKEPLYKNSVWYDGEEYWECDIKKVFGIIRDGKIIMVNGYVMITDYEDAKILLPQHLKKVRGTKTAQVIHVGGAKEKSKPLDILDGDMVYFNPNLAAKYQINNKPFRIIQQEKILGKQVY